MTRIALIIIFVALTFSSCKNQNSKEDASSKSTKIEAEEELGTPSFGNEKTELVAKIKNYIINNYLTEADLRAIAEDDRKFQLYQIDLNDDGKKEIFVDFKTSYFCGTGGCSLLLLNNQIEPITKFTVTRTPLYVERNLDNGWKAIWIQSDGKWRKLTFKDGSYPSNPSIVEVSSDSPPKDAEVLFEDNNDELKTYSF